MAVERIYTVPLRHGFRTAARYRKTNRAMTTLITFMERHMKSDDVRIGQHLNRYLWKNGARNPPPRVTVKATKDDEGVVRVELEGKAYAESAKARPKQEAESLKDRITQSFGGKEQGEKRPDEKDAKPATPPPAQKAPAKQATAAQAEKPAPAPSPAAKQPAAKKPAPAAPSSDSDAKPAKKPSKPAQNE